MRKERAGVLGNMPEYAGSFPARAAGGQRLGWSVGEPVLSPAVRSNSIAHDFLKVPHGRAEK